MINRFVSAIEPAEMKTYQIARPMSTHMRPGTCADVDCDAYRYGWRTTIFEGTEQGAAQAHYIRQQSGRKFVEDRGPDFTVFTFEAGQKCFAQHQMVLDRPALFVVRDGDWRGNPRGTQARIHHSADDWVDDFANHQQTIAEQIKRG